MVIGIGPNKEVTGISNRDEASRKLRTVIDLCRPRPNFTEEFVEYEGKIIIVIAVEPVSLSQNPCFFDKECYVRQGTTNEHIHGEALIDFLRRRTILNFEELKSPVKLSDLDEAKLKTFFEVRQQPLDLKEKEQLKTRLVALKCAAYNGDFYLKNVAPMFFSSQPQNYYDNLEVRIVVYKGTEKELEKIVSDERISGTIPELIYQSYEKLRQKVGKTFAIAGAVREERLDYPPEALREAVTNAIGHRDYFDPMFCLFEVYSDRLELTNPGGLLPGQTSANFDKNPLHRNPLTYKLLQDLKLGEGLGSGIIKMRKLCRMEGLPDPEFQNLGTAFRVIFYNKASNRKRHEVDGMNDRQRQAMALVEKNKTLKTSEYAKKVGVSQPTAVNDLNELVKQGKLRKVGKFRGAYYEIS